MGVCGGAAGLDGAEFVWGDAFTPGGRHMANTWQGEFPWQNRGIDGFAGTSPVGAFPWASCYGLSDMIGNREWTTDGFLPPSGRCVEPLLRAGNPRGGPIEASYDPDNPSPRPRKVLKGGCFCARRITAGVIARPPATPR